MSKYGNGVSTKEVKESEIKEVKEILKKYNVSKEDTEIITYMIEQAYYLIVEGYRYSEILTKMLNERGVTLIDITKAIIKDVLEKGE